MQDETFSQLLCLERGTSENVLLGSLQAELSATLQPAAVDRLHFQQSLDHIRLKVSEVAQCTMDFEDQLLIGLIFYSSEWVWPL